MPTRPDKLPKWATSGADIVEPNDSRKDLGWVNGERPAPEFFNWLANRTYEALAWMDDLLLHNWVLAGQTLAGDTADFYTDAVEILTTDGSTYFQIFLGKDVSANQWLVNYGVEPSLTAQDVVGTGIGADICRAIAYQLVSTDDATVVVVGDGGRIQWASVQDLTTWTAATSGTTEGFYSVAANSAIFLAGATEGVIKRDADGQGNWSAVTSPFGAGDTVRGFAYNGSSRWVAVTNTNKIATSDDNGATWTTRTSAFPASSNIYSVTYGNGRWVAVGRDDTSGGRPAAQYSTDGISWNLAATMDLNSFTSARVESVIYAANEETFYAVNQQTSGSLPHVLYISTDGANWSTAKTIPVALNSNTVPTKLSYFPQMGQKYMMGHGGAKSIFRHLGVGA